MLHLFTVQCCGCDRKQQRRISLHLVRQTDLTQGTRISHLALGGAELLDSVVFTLLSWLMVL